VERRAWRGAAGCHGGSGRCGSGRLGLTGPSVAGRQTVGAGGRGGGGGGSGDARRGVWCVPGALVGAARVACLLRGGAGGGGDANNEGRVPCLLRVGGCSRLAQVPSPWTTKHVMVWSEMSMEPSYMCSYVFFPAAVWCA